MNAHRPELAFVIRTHQQDLLARWNPVLSREQRKALRDIANCRSAALGGRVLQCGQCGHSARSGERTSEFRMEGLRPPGPQSS